MRRIVIERDSSTCQVCFTRSGDPYTDRPDKVARPTLGHRIPGKRLGKGATPDELQAECARCNEPVRDELFDPLTLPEVQPLIRGLRKQADVLKWLEDGRRVPTAAEQVYAAVRRLSDTERRAALAKLRRMVLGD